MNLKQIVIYGFVGAWIVVTFVKAFIFDTFNGKSFAFMGMCVLILLGIINFIGYIFPSFKELLYKDILFKKHDEHTSSRGEKE
jgi:hypothetical protein